MAKLFEPLCIGSITLQNRIAVSPMCEYSSEDGFANDWHLVHLGSRAVGGAGLLISEACAVSPEGRITAHDLGIWKDAHISELERITRFIRSQGSVAGIQLAHAGRKASCSQPWMGGKQIAIHEGGWQVVAPSAIPFTEDTMLPEAVTIEKIHQIIDDFRQAAIRSRKAGFQVLEIHAAHGYLLHQFYSPLSNRRTDRYGGSFENRIRLLMEIVAAVQEVWPSDLPLMVRISATDWTVGGWDLSDSVLLAGKLKEQGVHLIDCSSGGNVPHAKIPAGPGYQVAFAREIKLKTGILTGAVGLITGAEQAEQILNDGSADLILLAREMLRDPYFPLHAASQLKHDWEWPVQYQRAKK
ncbi:MAG: NADPH dehydrogenase NamA [Bacteroidota bacterium]|nr:NADPH dehydrogenase NamA [Bacteroidota bacterium]